MRHEGAGKSSLPGTSIIFLYTFKKAFSASLLLLLNASICNQTKKQVNYQLGRLIHNMGPDHLAGKGLDCIQPPSVLTTRRYVARNQSCFDSGCVGVSFPRSRLSCSADDGHRSFVACLCTLHTPPRHCWSLLRRVRVACVSALCSAGAGQLVCVRALLRTHTQTRSAPPAR